MPRVGLGVSPGSYPRPSRRRRSRLDKPRNHLSGGKTLECRELKVPRVFKAFSLAFLQPGYTANLGSPLNTRVSSDRHEPGPLPSYPPTRETDIDQRFDGFGTVRVLSELHRPNKNAILGVPQHFSEAPHLLAGRAAFPFEEIPPLFFDLGLHRLKTHCVLQDEVMIHPSFSNKDLEDAIQKRQIPTRIDGKPLICDFRSKQRRFGDRGHPVSLKSRFEVRVHDR